MSLSAHCLALRTARGAGQATRAWYRTPARHIACSAASPSGGGEVDPPDVQRLAQLAQVGVSEVEAAEWAPKIAGIVEWFGQLQAVDVEGVPPALRADVDAAASLRPDLPQPFENRGEMLEQVPQMDGPFVLVPKTGKGPDGEG